MKTTLIFLAFIALPLVVGWGGYEIGKGAGKVVEVEKECPLLANYCEPCEQEALIKMLNSKELLNK